MLETFLIICWSICFLFWGTFTILAMVTKDKVNQRLYHNLVWFFIIALNIFCFIIILI